jgi:hypothetical protein
MGRTMISASQRERLLELLARVLPAHERLPVLGDLREEEAGLLASSVEILSFAVRKEVVSWGRIDSWLVLLAITTPAAILLGSVSLSIADGSAIYVWLFASNWDMALLRQKGFWIALQSCLPALVWCVTVLVCWAWVCGSVIGLASRKTARTNGLLLLFYFIALWFGLRPPTADLQPLILARDLSNNAAAFRSDFYRYIFSPLVQVLFVLIPLLRGLRGAHRWMLGGVLVRGLFCLVSGASLVSLVAQSSVWWQRRTWTTSPALGPHLLSLTPLALGGGVAWLIARQANHSEPAQISQETN